MTRRKFYDVYLPATLSTSAGFWHRPVTSQDSEHALLCSILILWSWLGCCSGAASSMNHMLTLHAPVFTKRNETHHKFLDALMNIQLVPLTSRITYTDPYPLNMWITSEFSSNRTEFRDRFRNVYSSDS